MNKLISGGAWPDGETLPIQAILTEQPKSGTVVIVVRLVLHSKLRGYGC